MLEDDNEALVVVSDLASQRFSTSKAHFTDAPSPGSFVQLIVNSETKYQRLLGFGGAFTDASGRNIATLYPDLQDDLIRCVPTLLLHICIYFYAFPLSKR